MCGRFAQLPIEKPKRVLWPHLAEPLALLPARYNLAPGQTAGVLIKPKAEIELATLQWGLLPFWAKDLSLASHTINARLDTVDSKPSFRAAFKTRHAVIPMAGYYEWQATAQGKPANVVDRIAEGKVKEYYATFCLLEQPFVKDPKLTVGQLVQEKIAVIKENIVVRRFARYRLGEESGTKAVAE